MNPLGVAPKRLTQKKSPKNSNNIQDVFTTQNRSKMANDLTFVLNKIKSWKESLHNIDTARSEQILTEIISTLDPKSDHAMILDLQYQLSEEKARRNELETTVANLQDQIQAMKNESQAMKNEFQAHREDQRLINGLLDIFHLFKKFILVKERRKNSYSANFLSASAAEIFAAIHPEPIDPDLDNDVEIAYKQKILDLEDETSKFFHNIGVNKDVAYTLNRRLHIRIIRNIETHSVLDNKRMKDVDYVVGQLEHFTEDIEKVSENSSFVNEKGEIVKLLNDFQRAYVSLASPVS